MRFLNVDSKCEKSTHYLLFKRGSKIQCTPEEQKSPLNIAIIKRFSAVYHKKKWEQNIQTAAMAVLWKCIT